MPTAKLTALTKPIEIAKQTATVLAIVSQTTTTRVIEKQSWRESATVNQIWMQTATVNHSVNAIQKQIVTAWATAMSRERATAIPRGTEQLNGSEMLN